MRKNGITAEVQTEIVQNNEETKSEKDNQRRKRTRHKKKDSVSCF